MPSNLDPNITRPAKPGRADITLPPISEIFDVAYRGRDPRTLSTGSSEFKDATGRPSYEPYTSSPAYFPSVPSFTPPLAEPTGYARRPRTPPDLHTQGLYDRVLDQSHSSASYHSSYQESGQRKSSEYHQTRYHTHDSIAGSSSSSHHHHGLSEFRGSNYGVGTGRTSGVGHDRTRRLENDYATLSNSRTGTIGSDVDMTSKTMSPSIPSLNSSYTSDSGTRRSTSSRSFRQDTTSSSGSGTGPTSLPTSAVLQSQRFEGLARSRSASGSLSSASVTAHHSHARQEEYESEQGYDTSAPTSSATYQCTYCLKVFLRPSALKTHLISHTGEKDWECTEDGCGRRFGVRSNMLRHVRLIHQGTGMGMSRHPSSRGSDPRGDSEESSDV